MGAVGEREPLVLRAGEVLGQVGAVPAGLLVLPLAGHERRHVDLVDERDRVERVGHRRVVGRVFLDLCQQVASPRRAGPGWPRRSGRLPRIRLYAHAGRGGTGRFGVLLALFGPGDREAGVEDAAGVERRRRRVDRRQRRDRLEVGRPGLSGEQLADRAVGDAEHADLVVEHPRLVGDRLDHVVAVEVLQRFEEVVGAARAAGPAHVHVDHREAHQVGEHGDAVFRAGRVRVPVARVLDQRRVRRRVARRRHTRLREGREVKFRRHAGLAGRTGRRVHVDRQLGAVARRQIRVAVVGDRLVVDAGIPRRRGVRVDGERA